VNEEDPERDRATGWRRRRKKAEEEEEEGLLTSNE